MINIGSVCDVVPPPLPGSLATGGNAGSVKSTNIVKKDGVVYYEYELTKPHNLISAAVTDGQLYIINASAVRK